MLASLLGTLEILYVVVLSGWILLEKRSPASTLAWILALSFLPGVGFVVYLLIGPRRLSRKRLRHRRSRDLVRARAGVTRASADPAPWHEQLATLVTRSTGSPSASAREVRVLPGGKETFDAIEAAIRAATDHVHVCYYIFEHDRTGARIMSALVERARAGVHVRLLVDALGSALPSSFVRPLVDAGGSFARFNPVLGGRLLPRIDFRNHRKLVVCDGDVGFMGGINVGDEYDASVSQRSAYRDTHLLLEGSAVRQLQLAFLEDWTYATGEVPTARRLLPEASGPEPHAVQVVASGPDLPHQSIRDAFFAAIAGAHARVLITTPYFVPDEAILVALCTAALRGVEVRVVVPRRSDSRIVSAAARSYFDRLLAAGVHIHEYPRMIHAKTMVVDGKLAFVGSANMDNRSFSLNFELTAMLSRREAIDALEALFASDVQVSNHITARSRSKLSLAARLGESCARVLSPLL